MCNEESEGSYQAEQQAIEALDELMQEEARIERLKALDSLELWETKLRRRIDYKDLKDQHLLNIIHMLRRTQSLHYVPRLCIEHRRRGLEPNEAT